MRRLGRPRDDRGFAMVMVIGAMAALLALILVAMTMVMRSERFSRFDQDYNGALAAAQAGLDEFMRERSLIGYPLETEYYYYYCKEEFKGPVTAPGCGWGPGTPIGWKAVDRSAKEDAASYHLEMTFAADDESGDTGPATIRSTGKVNNVYRTLEMVVVRATPADYLYFSDYEANDPADRIAYPSSEGPVPIGCGREGYGISYKWGDGYGDRPTCQELAFSDQDVLDGRVVSNDSIEAHGTVFLGKVESGYPQCAQVEASDPSTWGSCLRAGSTAQWGTIAPSAYPTYVDYRRLITHVSAHAATATCTYTGATRVILNETSAQVWSKDTVTSSVTCGTAAALQSEAGATVKLGSVKSIHVTTAAKTVPREEIEAGKIGGPDADNRLPLGSYSKGSDYYVHDKTMVDPAKHRGEGNLYVEGVLEGKVTFSATQSIIVTGDLIALDGVDGPNLIGLEANNSVEIMHPRMVTVEGGTTMEDSEDEAGSGAYASLKSWPKKHSEQKFEGIEINAAIQAHQHSFYVQNYNVGSPKGEIRLLGSVAQQWRGAIGKDGSGYTATYTYDRRLESRKPPYFQGWAYNAPWRVQFTGEILTDESVKTG